MRGVAPRRRFRDASRACRHGHLGLPRCGGDALPHARRSPRDPYRFVRGPLRRSGVCDPRMDHGDDPCDGGVRGEARKLAFRPLRCGDSDGARRSVRYGAARLPALDRRRDGYRRHQPLCTLRARSAAPSSRPAKTPLLWVCQKARESRALRHRPARIEHHGPDRDASHHDGLVFGDLPCGAACEPSRQPAHRPADGSGARRVRLGTRPSGSRHRARMRRTGGMPARAPAPYGLIALVLRDRRSQLRPSRQLGRALRLPCYRVVLSAGHAQDDHRSSRDSRYSVLLLVRVSSVPFSCAHGGARYRAGGCDPHPGRPACRARRCRAAGAARRGAPSQRRVPSRRDHPLASP